MTKVNNMKKLIVSLLIVFLATLFGGFYLSTQTNVAKAEDGVTTLEEVDLSMQEGAQIKDGTTAADMGLRFAVTLPKADYDGLKANPDYTSVSFGILIAPKNYDDVKPLKEFAFGDNAFYDWADADGNYTGSNGANGSKVRIINLQSNIMVAMADNPDVMRYYGSLVDIKANNLDKEFVGVGYIQCETANGFVYKYATANDNVRSVAYQAQLTIEKGYDTDGVLQSTFIDPAPNKTAAYSVEHYVKQDGAYVYSTTTQGDTATWGESVTAQATEILGYEVNETESAATKTGKIYANDKLTLKLYYDPVEIEKITHVDGLADVNGKLDNKKYDLVNLLTESEQSTYAEYAAISDITWTLTEKSTCVLNDASTGWNDAIVYTTEGGASYTADGTKIDFATAPYTVYQVKATTSDGVEVFEGQVDFYDSSEAPVWNVVSEAGVSDVWGWAQNTNNKYATVAFDNAVDGKEGSFYKLGTTTDVTGWGSTMHYNVKAIHSKAYYELYQDYNFKFDYSVIDTYNGVGFAAGANTTDGWYTGEISVATLVEKWNAIHGTWTNVEWNAMFASAGVKPNADFVYMGNFQMVIDLDIEKIAHVDGLADVNGKLENKTYDLLNLLTDSEKQAYEKYEKYNTITWTLTKKSTYVLNDASTGWVDTIAYTTEGGASYTANGTKIDFATVPYTVYQVKATTADGAEVFEGQVDFYDSSEAPVWNVVSEAGVSDVWGWAQHSNNKYATMKFNNAVDGKEGSFYELGTTTNTTDWGTTMHYNVKAIHSKAYYELYQDYTFKFDYYIAAQYNGVGFAAGANTTAGWYTGEISVATLVEHWNAIHGTWTNVEWDAMFASAGLYANNNSVYIGNFQMVKAEA